MRQLIERCYRFGRGPLLGALVLCSAGSATWVATRTTGVGAGAAAETPSAAGERESGKLRRAGADHLLVPDEMARRLGITTAVAVKPTRARQLAPFQGRLALENNALRIVRSRFAGEVAELGTTHETLDDGSRQPGRERPLRYLDRVTKGQLLAVVWSKDVGEKKSELIDAISKLRDDEATLERLEALLKESATSERNVRDARRAVQADRVALAKAERTLRSWRLTEEEIAAVRAEADRLADPKAERADPASWARVEVRAPISGVILDMTVAVDHIVDTTTDLFKIADLSHLAVWAHVYEEDLPLLQSLPKPTEWRVDVPSRPGLSFRGTLDNTGAMIDPNQQTALVTGRVENPGGALKVGQFVTVSVELPTIAGEVEVPAEAVVEDGRESVVFVRVAAGEFVRRRVEVIRRFRDVIYLKSGVTAGEVVVTGAALLLRDAFEQLPAGGG